jgi:ADP-L-glycero-D-manno-heptose 6-epimerase
VRVVVTGAAGFIGSNLARALNDRGVDDVIAVDSLVNGDKFRNLVDLSLADYIDADTFIAELEKGRFGKIDAIFHQGACSDTMERDGRYMLLNNFQYSKDLLSYCLTSTFVPDAENERPLNVYGYSKLLFDQYVRRILPTTALQITGFRYFNVYGPHEEHKGRMASVAFHHFNQYRDHGRVKLFSSYGGFGDGGHSRDFVYVRDVTDVNCWFLENPDARGIYNLGTGHSQPFNDLAQAVVNVMRHGDGLPPLSLEQQVNQGLIEYIPFPDDLRGKYQSFTEADISGLRNAGYSAPFATVAEGITDYMGKLIAPHQQL